MGNTYSAVILNHRISDIGWTGQLFSPRQWKNNTRKNQVMAHITTKNTPMKDNTLWNSSKNRHFAEAVMQTLRYYAKQKAYRNCCCAIEDQSSCHEPNLAWLQWRKYDFTEKEGGNIVENQRTDIQTAAAEVSHNVAEALLIPQFFIKPNIRRVGVEEISAQYWSTLTSPVPPLFLSSAYSCVVLPTIVLIMISQDILPETPDCEPPSIKTSTKLIPTLHIRRRRNISNVSTCHATRSWSRYRDGIQMWDVERLWKTGKQ